MVWVVGMAIVAFAALPQVAEAATIGGTVWEDRDRDGRRERGERLLPSITVEVQRSARQGRPFRRVVRRTTTIRGVWSLKVTRAGRYRVRLRLPAGTRLTTPNRDRRDRIDSDLRLVRGVPLSPVRRMTRRSKSVRFDAGLILPSPPPPLPPPANGAPPTAPAGTSGPPVVGDRVWRDDGDGIQEPGEPGVPGAAVELWDAGRTTRLAATTSDAEGRWSLAAPAGVPVRVRVVLPTGATYARPRQGADRAADSDIARDGATAGFSEPVIGAPGQGDVDIGLRFTPPAQIGNRLWFDANANGIQDPTETSAGQVQNRTVELWNASLTQRLAVTTTAIDGGYVLTAPSQGAYRVRFVLDAVAYGFSPRDQGMNDALDSDAEWRFNGERGVTAPFELGGDRDDIDAGLVNTATLGNKVWRDVDGDGVQETGEPGIAGLPVELWNADKTERLASTTSAADGTYTLRTPQPGTYRIRVVPPFGLSFTLKGAGGDTTLDSNINPSGADAWYTDPIAVAFNLISNTSIDAGLRAG